jgi:hypothetical protein
LPFADAAVCRRTVTLERGVVKKREAMPASRPHARSSGALRVGSAAAAARALPVLEEAKERAAALRARAREMRKERK